MKRKIGKSVDHAKIVVPVAETLDPHRVLVDHWSKITGKPHAWVEHKLIEIGHMAMKQMTGGVNDARREIDALAEAVSAKIAADQQH